MTEENKAVETAAAPEETVAVSAETAPAETAEVKADAPVEAKGESLLSGGGEKADEAIAEFKIPDEYKDDKIFKDIKDYDGLFKSYKNAQDLIGKKVTDMSPEDLKKYNEKLGAPADLGSYEIADLPEGSDIDWAKEAAHKAGLTNDQLNALVKAGIDRDSAALANMQEAAEIQHQKDIESLKEDFGTNFDVSIEKTKQAVKFFGGEELAQILNNAGLGTDPTVVKAFHEASKLLKESSFVKAGTDQGNTAFDKKTAIVNFRKEHSKALHDATHPEHKHRVEELQRFYRM